jgi:Cu+-exporting ATPase
MGQIHHKIDKRPYAICYHCGESCKREVVNFDDKEFCCEGCKQVYDLLKENKLCTYYNLNNTPGISPSKGFYSSKYNYLNNAQVAEKIIRFTDGKEAHVVFYIPKIHCSSCIWLLENLHRLNHSISSSTINFLKKEATIIFDVQKIKLSEIVQLLAHIGYEPIINLGDLDKTPARATNTSRIIKIGIAGFCFGNIMMLSFPEYFSFGNFQEQASLQYFFAYLNLFLSLPVFFYSASDFFISAWKSIRYHYLNIDAPIALAIVVTFFRSVYEILSQTGVGYMDSMSGIVFFMLIGRYFQNQTYETLSFERDYKSYFPVGVTRINKNGDEVNQSVTDLKKGDRIVIRNNELIPSDSILISNQTHVDYSFITGESAPIKKMTGELIYAGGKQLEGAIVLEVVNPTSQSYLTQLWNQDKGQQQTPLGKSYIDKISKYFTIVVLSISLLSALYWLSVDRSKALNAMTAVLIVACPCGLLLTTTFAQGNILRILGRNKFYLKNSSVIDKLSKANTILFDKTGTITNGSVVNFIGPSLSNYELALVCSLAAQSSHPLSRKIYSQFNGSKVYSVTDFQEVPGKGIKGYADGRYVILGSEYYVMGADLPNNNLTTKVFLMIDGEVIGYFGFTNVYRDGLEQLLIDLEPNYNLQLISGDNDAEREKLKFAFGKSGQLFFNQKPEEKMTYVQKLKAEGKNVMMIGDGLNDAGALRQSDIGIAVSDDTNNFSPACDAILDGSSFSMLPAFIKLAKSGKKVIITTFIISLIYNIAGLTFAVQGTLAPVIAAILMPISSISIVLIAILSTTCIAKIKGLRN